MSAVVSFVIDALQFKPGPFISGLPVLPVCIDYSKNKHCDLWFGG